MDWTKIGHIADIFGILSFIASCISIVIGSFILAKTRKQKAQYKKQRKELYENLVALRDNIWTDKLLNDRIFDTLQTTLYEYRMKYWLLSSPICHYHIFMCLKLLSKEDFKKNKQNIRRHINYLIARLTQKE